MTAKTKVFILVTVLLLVVWAAVSLSTQAPQISTGSILPVVDQDNNSTPATGAEPPAAPDFIVKERRFAVVAVKPDGFYLVRDLASNKEIELFIPEDANITAGQRSDIAVGAEIIVQRYIEAVNGLVAAELSIATDE